MTMTDPVPAESSAATPRHSPVISVSMLAAALSGGHPPVVLDVRWSLAGPGYSNFLAGHVPGAQFVDLDRDLAAPPGPGGRHPLPDAHVVAALAARAGIDRSTAVVVCGERDTSIAARAWWLLRAHGYADVAVLDGGFAAWQAAGQPVETGSAAVTIDGAAPAAAVATSDVLVMPTVDADGAAGHGADPHAVLMDARAPERYRGDSEPVDPVPGHIPGAVNVPLSAVHRRDGTLKAPAELREIFAAAGVVEGTAAVASCGSGVTACSLILAAEVAGLSVALYPGSYSGWCALGRPVEAG